MNVHPVIEAALALHGLVATGRRMDRSPEMEMSTGRADLATKFLANWLQEVGHDPTSAHDALGLAWTLGSCEFVATDGSGRTLKVSWDSEVYRFKVFG